jgi:hypothetical protein
MNSAVPEWLCILSVRSATRPGVIGQLGELFAERAINLDEVYAGLLQGRPTVLLRFAASEKARGFLLRRLSRVPGVLHASIEPARNRTAADVLRGAVSAP